MYMSPVVKMAMTPNFFLKVSCNCIMAIRGSMKM